MKQFLIKVLASLGLVSARRYAVLAERVEALKHETRTWKKRADRSDERVKALAAEIERYARIVKELRASIEQANPEQGRELSAMQARLEETERELNLAREHLMAIEVKLDILEGAANVLDARTRTVSHRKPSETGAAV